MAFRLKYMQRRHFPDGANPGPGGKVSYGLEQILQTLVAFELLDAGLTPLAAAAVVRAAWEETREALIEAWWCRRVPVAFADRPMIALEGELDQDGAVQGGRSSFRRAGGLAAAINAGQWPRRALVLEPVTMMNDLARLLPVVAGIGEDELSRAFEELVASLN